MRNYTLSMRAGSIAMIVGFVLPLVSGALPALASSHREAPLISVDRQADATDLYAFVSPDKQDTLTLIANYNPFEEPAGGPNFYQFGNDVLYEIKIDNNGDAKEDISYQFKFARKVGNDRTFLYNVGPVGSASDANFNAQQTYTLTKVENGTATVLVTDAPVPPVNIGPKSTPNYTAISDGSIKSLSDGTKVFAGQADDPFFVELGGIFDLLTIRKLPGNMGGGVDGLSGYNVQTLALQVPIASVTSNHQKPASAADTNAVIGVWTTASRQATRVLNGDGTQTNSGNWVQVSRLGAPLVNEVVIPLGKKDVWNASMPKDDGQFANFVTNPELGGLFKGLYNIQVPPQGDFGSASQRDDLIAIFLTGVKGLTQPASVTPSEELRVNLGIAPTANPNRMGVLAGDNQGYPNGRRLADDVTDISLRAVAGAAYPLFHKEFKPDATGVQLGDGVDVNDMPFRATFPYVAVANSGYASNPHISQAILDGLVSVVSQAITLVSSLLAKK